MKPPEMLWSPTRGLLIKQRGWWYRLTYASGETSVAHEAIHPLPPDVQTVWVADEPWLIEALKERASGEEGTRGRPADPGHPHAH